MIQAKTKVNFNVSIVVHYLRFSQLLHKTAI